MARIGVVATAGAGGDTSAAGPLVRDEMSEWARDMAGPVTDALDGYSPATAVTSLFGVEVMAETEPQYPWAVINSTFYVGPRPPRSIEEDFAPRAVPLIQRFASLLSAAALTLHATDQVFDLSFDRLPEGHRYVGPLGLWEPRSETPTYLDEPGDPWVLVSISSQLQDDLPLAAAAAEALSDQPVRVVLTVGPHDAVEFPAASPTVHVEQVIPHSAVLRRGSLLVSHAGHGSVMKALWYGRPMVLVPWGRDQPGVAARAEALQVAIVVERESATPGALNDAVSRSLRDKRMSERAQHHSERLEGTDPSAAAAAALEELL